MKSIQNVILLKTLHNPSIACEFKWFVRYTISIFISTCTRPMVTKHGKVVTLREAIPPKHSHNHLNLCTREVTLQIKTQYLHNTYVHKTYQGDDILWGVSTHIFAWKIWKILFQVSQDLWLLNLKNRLYLNFSPMRYFNILCMTGNIWEKYC